MRQQTAPVETRGPESAVVLGEVRTGLVAHHSALRRSETERLLDWLVPGGRVLSWERPVPHARSAPALTGLDCRLALGPEGKKTVRAVGTLETRAALTGGTILQCATHATVRPAESGRREPWSHYTSRPGVLETIVAQQAESIVEGFLGEGGQAGGIADFNAVGERLARRVQNAPMLEGRSPLLFQWTRLRWAVTVGASADAEANVRATLRLGDGGLRTLRAEAASADVADIAEFCGDLALHDWILSTVVGHLDELAGAAPERELAEFGVILSRLRHLWMPAARVSPELSVLWREFEAKPGFTRQWRSLVARMRDHIALHTAQQLGVLINHDKQCT